MRKTSLIFLFVTLSVFFSCQQKKSINQTDRLLNRSIQNDSAAKSIVRLENNNVTLLVNLNGGAFIDFHFRDLPVNPINWRMKDSSKFSFMGHFLAFDRWGPPTSAEAANGFHHHGEANSEVWNMITPLHTEDGKITCSMMCTLPMGGMQLTRKIDLSENEPLLFVTEEIKNLNKYGRMFNIVQHVSIAPPFLDTTTLFDNNTVKGFEGKEDGSMNQEEVVLKWPEATHKGEIVSFRQFQNVWPRVSSFLYSQNDSCAWVTACNPKKRIMLGYVWKPVDYPWINFWRSMENGIPEAFGMEFGTTGLHEPFPVVAKKGKIFDQNIYAFIDANEVISKSFTAFLAKIPEDYKGVKNIEIRNSLLIIKERNMVSRVIVYHLK